MKLGYALIIKARNAHNHFNANFMPSFMIKYVCIVIAICLPFINISPYDLCSHCAMFNYIYIYIYI